MLQVVLEIKAPLNPGVYQVTMGLVHGFDDSFQIGDDITLRFSSKLDIYDSLQSGGFNLETFYNFANEDVFSIPVPAN